MTEGFNLGDVLTDADASKLYHRLKEHGTTGFHEWCLRELVEPHKEKLQELIGDYDPNYVAYMLEAISIKVLTTLFQEKHRNDKKEATTRRVPSSLEALAGRKDWWKST